MTISNEFVNKGSNASCPTYVASVEETVLENTCEALHIEQALVEALAGERVHGVGGVTGMDKETYHVTTIRGAWVIQIS